jgi:glycerophosphoryl diester phosphodiesterase
MSPNLLRSVTFSDWPYPKICAHRGAGKLAPENTFAAFQKGASLGHTMFEFDVKLSADNVSFLLHDDTVDRTTTGQGAAAVFSMSALEALGLPRFALIANWLLENKLLANVEIKPSPGREAETGAKVAWECWQLWNAFEEASGALKPTSEGRLIPPLLSSFSEVALAAARDAVPDLPRALLLHKLPDDWLLRCRSLGVVALDANYKELNATIIATAKASHLRVLSYTVNEAQVMQDLFAAGLDCAITDEVAQFSP